MPTNPFEELETLITGIQADVDTLDAQVSGLLDRVSALESAPSGPSYTVVTSLSDVDAQTHEVPTIAGEVGDQALVDFWDDSTTGGTSFIHRIGLYEYVEATDTRNGTPTGRWVKIG